MIQSPVTEEDIFKVALQIQSAEARGIYLRQACGSDPALQQRIVALLDLADQKNSFLERPPAGYAPTVAPPPISERPGDTIGPYKLMEQIGEGGFGLVFVAEQHEPVRRKVALKVIKPGMDTREVVARFEAERQALAMMDHPHIAKVLDAGTTQSGRPYFVMELVRGIPITDYCDANQLTPRQRLELFINVCQAVQHAHQKGVIHRDLKPNNILVAPHDGIPVVKVIDFGVAKALGQQLTDKTIYTRFAQMIGTPLYMSPEQAEINALDVDTRSDVYSLGVLLYELLTGTTPFDKKRLASAAFDEIRRIIREEEPPKPSTRISQARSAHTRSPSPDPRTPNIQHSSFIIQNLHELDWIVMKALEKDRTRRYETASSFAADVGRYLRDEPVNACPPSLIYRLSKFTRRYKAPLAVAAGFLALLLAGTAVTTWQAIRAKRAEAIALDSERKAREAAEAAEQAKDAEASQRKLAETNEQVALHEKDKTVAAQEDLRETLYAAEMNLVEAAWESKQYKRAAQLLDQQRPQASQADLRGFEWHYWRRQLHRGRIRSLEIPRLANRLPPLAKRSFSRDGTRLTAIVEYPAGSPLRGLGQVATFDCLTGRELLAPYDPFPDLQQTGRRFLRMAMSGDGSRIAVADRFVEGSPLSIRDGGTGNEIFRTESIANLSEFAFTPDGSRLAVEYVEPEEPTTSRVSAGQAGIKVWDTSTGDLVQTLPLLPWKLSNVNRLVWSPDGARLVRFSVTPDTDSGNQLVRQRIQSVEIGSAQVLWERPFDGLSDPKPPWAFSPDGKLLVVAEYVAGSKPNLQLWDGHSGATLAILDRPARMQIVDDTIDFSPDGKRFAVSSTANEIYVWDVPKLPGGPGAEPIHIAAPDLTLHTDDQIVALKFSADGRQLVTVDGQTSVVTWDTTAREDRGTGPDVTSFSSAISAGATKVAFSSWTVATVRGASLWDLAGNREVLRLDTSSFANPGFSSDGRRVAFVRSASTAQEESQLLIHDTQSGAALLTIPVEHIDPPKRSIISDVLLRPGGGQVAALLTSSSTVRRARIRVWDDATGKPLFFVDINEDTEPRLSYTQGGASLVVAIGDRSQGTLLYYDAATGVHQRSVSIPASSRAHFIDDKALFVGAQARSEFVLCDLATGKERLRLPGYDSIGNFAISPDGSRLVLGKGSRDGESELSLWSLKTGRRLLARERPGFVSAISFSPDGNKILATFTPPTRLQGIHHSIQIWDATPLPEEP